MALKELINRTVEIKVRIGAQFVGAKV